MSMIDASVDSVSRILQSISSKSDGEDDDKFGGEGISGVHDFLGVENGTGTINSGNNDTNTEANEVLSKQSSHRLNSGITSEDINCNKNHSLNSSNADKKILCQNINRNFKKTPRGKVLENNLKDVYSLMILNLKLTENNIHNHHGNKKFSIIKPPPFSFTMEEGIVILKNLTYNIETSISTISLSYQLNNNIGDNLLVKFYDAKLLHSPQDRTRVKIKSGVYLQPTPKGVTILKQFISDNGIKFQVLPDILSSTLNSMELFVFERNYLNDKIIYSNHLIKILFIKMFGMKPNVWSPFNEPEKFKINIKANLNYLDNDNIDIVSHLKDNYVTSPLYHKYFTNPESDSHVQYFLLTSGVRVFYNKVIGDVKYRYLVSGKAIGQWLMDCTDSLSIKSVIEIGNLFIKVGLLAPIQRETSFSTEHSSFYTITDYGKNKLCWYRKRKLINKPMKNMATGTNDKKFTKNYDLKDFLSDPGLKYLFKLHSINEFCGENIDAYNQLNLYTKKFKLLHKLISYIQSTNANKSIDFNTKCKNHIIKISNDCLSLAYHIYFTYLSTDASFILNIDYNLRRRITSILIENDKSFDTIYNQNYLKTPILENESSSSNFKLSGETTMINNSEADEYMEAEVSNTLQNNTNEEFSSDNIRFNDNEPIGITVTEENINITLKMLTSISLDSNKSKVSTLNLKTGEQEDDNTSIFSSHPSVDKNNIIIIDEAAFTAPSSPRDKEFNDVYNLLTSFTPIANELMMNIYRMMEVDSFSKFVTSELFHDYSVIFDET